MTFNYLHICNICLGWMVDLKTYFRCKTCNNVRIEEKENTLEPTKTLLEAQARYGLIKDNKWENESKFMVIFKVPKEITDYCINSATGKPLEKIYCNREIVNALKIFFNSLIQCGLHKELKTFDGCFNIRNIRGGNSTSTHSYGIAFDINAKENPLGGNSNFPSTFIELAKDAGFTWGGDFKRKDPMHFQWCLW